MLIDFFLKNLQSELFELLDELKEINNLADDPSESDRGACSDVILASAAREAPIGDAVAKQQVPTAAQAVVGLSPAELESCEGLIHFEHRYVKQEPTTTAAAATPATAAVVCSPQTISMPTQATCLPIPAQLKSLKVKPTDTKSSLLTPIGSNSTSTPKKLNVLRVKQPLQLTTAPSGRGLLTKTPVTVKIVKSKTSQQPQQRNIIRLVKCDNTSDLKLQQHRREAVEKRTDGRMTQEKTDACDESAVIDSSLDDFAHIDFDWLRTQIDLPTSLPASTTAAANAATDLIEAGAIESEQKPQHLSQLATNGNRKRKLNTAQQKNVSNKRQTFDQQLSPICQQYLSVTSDCDDITCATSPASSSHLTDSFDPFDLLASPMMTSHVSPMTTDSGCESDLSNVRAASPVGSLSSVTSLFDTSLSDVGGSEDLWDTSFNELFPNLV